MKLLVSKTGREHSGKGWALAGMKLHIMGKFCDSLDLEVYEIKKVLY